MHEDLKYCRQENAGEPAAAGRLSAKKRTSPDLTYFVLFLTLAASFAKAAQLVPLFQRA